ncbi:LuxR C-terminal-related transcriptional regulator [Pseudomonas sp. RIT-PI-AD]|uniref:LuxR C-terminal-related transcriptional regulator n=1 Tax=Pseudomonas sp. RIT-PI-AD TaxID=3035294 RepID=UPI0021DA48D6|nr:LuxR C-terminal-related transcriptional regulator [Pseudomonas sp. RIT-PI-AD]
MSRPSPSVPACRPAGLPRLPPAHLPRPRLVERLLAGDWRLRVLIAPAGFGKSVLLGESLRQLPDAPPLAWLGLNGQPGSRQALLDGLAGALGLPLPNVAPEHRLIGQLMGLAQPLWLVLDDYPKQPDPGLDACIEALLAQPGLPLRLLVSARQRPAWNLPRLLLAGELLELDAHELAFDAEETARLVERLAPNSSIAERDALWRETRGWCAGVPLSLAGRHAREGANGPCWLKEYLDHELLAHLDGEARQDLLTLAHLPRASAEFCAQLWEERDGAALFERLLQHQAFFLPLDRHGVWYRLLPAVAQMLRAHAAGSVPASLHLRACRLFIAAGRVEEAIEQALSAGQPEVAATYLERLGQEWLTGERHLAHLLAWRDRFPEHLLDSSPRLLTLNAWASLLAWRLDEAEACLDKLGRFLPRADGPRTRRLLANAQALRGALGALRGLCAEEAQRDCRQALEHLDDRDWMPALLCQSALARIALASGQPEQAPLALNTARELARRHGSLLFEVFVELDRIHLLLLRGEPDRAQHAIHKGFSLLAQRETRDSLLLGRLHLAQAELHLAGDRLEEAGESLRLGLGLALECADPLALLGDLGLAELAARRGAFDQAFVHLGEAERRMHCRQVYRFSYQGMLSLQSMQVFARQGDWARLETVGARIGRYFDGERPWMSPYHCPSLALRNRLLLARAGIARGDLEAAATTLRDLAQRCDALHFKPLADEARRALAEADRRRGRSVAGPLRQGAPHDLDRLALPGLASPAPDSAAQDPQGLLSQREQAVLQLLAEGFSNQEIGSYLFISVNTVKTHTKKINSKLGVKRRTQAVMRAKVLGLLV